MKKILSILKYVSFFIVFIWLYLFTIFGSFRKYEWMLSDPLDDITWCNLPWDNDSLREGMYVPFLFQFAVVGVIFLRKKNWLFSSLMFLLFCYATYAFMVRDMFCVSFLRW